ncbi:MAG: hypothetical protein RJA35_1407 [Actinomycetota bacterium]|jgi:magnesium chelatase family protein
MTLSKVHSIGLYALEGTVIEVEVDISAQLPAFVLVGLPDASLSESTSRVRAACTNIGFPLPSKKVVVNLSPAAVPKSGSSFDLAIAVSVLAAMDVIPAAATKGACFIGELGLGGSIRAVPGVLPMVLAARKAGFTRVFVAQGNLAEAALVEGVSVSGHSSFSQLVACLRGLEAIHFAETGVTDEPVAMPSHLDLQQVIGQDAAVEGLIVAAAGGHHLSMIGAPGAGKTMLAERLPGILPPLSVEQAVELAAIESIAGDGQAGIKLNRIPRFQSPHHSVSRAAMIGGGTGSPNPGAVSLAHHGVLFLDEALEFQVTVLEALREPLEAGSVVIGRASGSAVYPARFQLVLAANPCPCGNNGSLTKDCTCSFQTIRRYGSKLSGPILDRIDIRLAIQPVTIGAASGLATPPISTADAAARVATARQTAAERLSVIGRRLNGHVPGTEMRKHFKPGAKALTELDKLLGFGASSMRGYDRCLRLAWTLADLDGTTTPSKEHVQRAVALRGTETLVGN